MRGTRMGAALLALSSTVVLMGAQCGTTAPAASSAFRFTIAAGSGARAPLYVQAVELDGQPGWIRLRHASGERVFLTPRCDVRDCGKPEVTCGASVPIVERLAAAGAATFTWDGTESVFDAASGCETRRAAAAGRYVATFCFAREADVASGSPPADRMQGTVKEPVCTDVEFTLPGSGTLTYEIPTLGSLHRPAAVGASVG